MRDRAHTPGPWEVRFTKGGYGEDCWVVQQSDSLAVVGEFYPRWSVEANAHLIAAAPDMLEALEHIALQGDIGDPSAMIDIARAALSKALGEPNPVEGGET